MIDKRAVIDSSAQIADGVTIAPFAVIGPDVEIDSGCWIGPHAVIKGPTKIGKENKIFQFSSVGEDPQDKKYQGERTRLEIGDRNVIREFCTIDRGTVQDKGVTHIGDDNLFMSYVHIAHDCHISNHTIFANNACLAGHVHVDDHVILGGFSAVHQFCHLGKHCFLASGALALQDVPPFIRVSGSYAKPCGLNVLGLRRWGFDSETRLNLKRAYKIIFRKHFTINEAIEQLEKMLEVCPEVSEYIAFLKKSTRGIVR